MLSLMVTDITLRKGILINFFLISQVKIATVWLQILGLLSIVFIKNLEFVN